MGQVARTLDQMVDRLEHLLKAERRLVQYISHELRSPLARLSVAVELARSSDDPETQLNRIQKEADRLNSLVGELLQVTRAEGDPSKRKRDAVRLDELVASVTGDCLIEAEARGCSIRLDAGPETVVLGDAELLRRAVENVLRNAIRFAPEGTAVEVKVNGGAIQIRDFGPGVPLDSVERLFDAFYRVDTDRNRNSGGVGLGLSIAKRAVELHGCSITGRHANPGLLVEITLTAASPGPQLLLGHASASGKYTQESR